MLLSFTVVLEDSVILMYSLKSLNYQKVHNKMLSESTLLCFYFGWLYSPSEENDFRRVTLHSLPVCVCACKPVESFLEKKKERQIE